MNTEKIVEEYLTKSAENFKLYEFLNKEGKFIEWQAVSIFYSSLCHVKAYLFSKPSIPRDSLNSHLEIKQWLVTESTSKRLMIYENYYNYLYSSARDARYKCKKINPTIIHKMLQKHESIKAQLKITM